MQPERWRLVFYVARSGRMPAKGFLDELVERDPERYAYFQDVLLPLLNEHGPALGEPIFKRLGFTGLCEIRWSGSDRGHHRLYCAIASGRRLLLLHGCTKRWRRFDKLDHQVCLDRYQDNQSSDYDAAQRLARS